jgi:hypothetical protein
MSLETLKIVICCEDGVASMMGKVSTMTLMPADVAVCSRTLGHNQ